jgi:hypothetical protein
MSAPEGDFGPMLCTLRRDGDSAHFRLDFEKMFNFVEAKMHLEHGLGLPLA